MEVTQEMRQAYADWLNKRPATVQVVAEKFSIWRLYRMKSTGHRVGIRGFDENEGGAVTVRVLVLQEFNPDRVLAFDREVFGILPDDLEEAPDER